MSHHAPGCKGSAFTEGPSGCLLCGGRMFPAPEPVLSKEEAFDICGALKEGDRVRVAQRPVSPEERPFAGLEGRFLRYSMPRGFTVIAVKEADAKDVLDRLATPPANGEAVITLHPESLRRAT